MRSGRARSSPEHRCEGVRTHRGLPALRAVARRGAGHPINGLGGPAGFGTNSLARNDDGSTPRSPSSRPFLGRQFLRRDLHLDLRQQQRQHHLRRTRPDVHPIAFPISAQPMLARTGDVDTRGRGIDASRQNLAYYHVDATGRRFIVTWYDVGYFASATSRLDSFQLILTNRDDVGPGDFDVEYRFNRCEWTTGDASGGVGGLGGTEAQMGWDAGDLTNFWSHPDSQTPAILNLCTTSNVGDPASGGSRPLGNPMSCGDGFLDAGEVRDGNAPRQRRLHRLRDPDADLDTYYSTSIATTPPLRPPGRRRGVRRHRHRLRQLSRPGRVRRRPTASARARAIATNSTRPSTQGPPRRATGWTPIATAHRLRRGRRRRRRTRVCAGDCDDADLTVGLGFPRRATGWTTTATASSPTRTSTPTATASPRARAIATTPTLGSSRRDRDVRWQRFRL